MLVLVCVCASNGRAALFVVFVKKEFSGIQTGFTVHLYIKKKKLSIVFFIQLKESKFRKHNKIYA